MESSLEGFFQFRIRVFSVHALDKVVLKSVQILEVGTFSE